jgi:hypothetical protein
MMTVPIQPLPNQTLQVQLANQACTINLVQNAYGLFFDLFVGNTPIVQGVICENANRLVRNVYFGFIGDFAFQDTQGNSDPVYAGLGTRYLLQYLEAADIAGLPS